MNKKGYYCGMTAESRLVDRAVRKKVKSDFFQEFARHHCVFLRELTAEYKSNGDFPVFPCSVLPQYYTDVEDIEVAAVIGLMIKVNDDSMKNIREFVTMFGGSPYKWLRERHFMSLDIGSLFFDVTGGVRNDRIANVASLLYDYKVGHTIKGTMQDLFNEMFGKMAYNYWRLMTLVFKSSDGIGLGLWSTMPLDIKSPLTDKVLAFIDEWIPDYRRYMTADDAIHLFGFADDYDFFYAQMAWDELCRRKPIECSRYSTQYNCAYKSGRWIDDFIWKRMIRTLRDEV